MLTRTVFALAFAGFVTAAPVAAHAADDVYPPHGGGGRKVPPSKVGELPFTGSQIGAPLAIGGGLLVGGGALVIAVRRRSTTD